LIPKILFLTCIPLTEPKSASMAFMNVLLERYPVHFAWFSTRGEIEPAWNPHKIPYSACPSPRRPARFTSLRLVLTYFLWPLTQALRAARFARRNGCEVVLADLAFEAVISGRLAAQFARLPLLVNIHDDPVSRLRVKGHPAWFLRWYEAQFAKTLRAAWRVGVISNSMGEVYQQRYDVRTTTLYIGVEEGKCLPARCPDPQKQPILITSLGSVNSTENWNLLIAAVRRLNSQSGEEKFRILHIGSLNARLATTPEVEVTGWLPEKEFLRQLDRADICFLNASFAPEQAEVGRLSFPLKIHSYIQAQRPMLALGFSESSVVRFVLLHECGSVCEQADEALLAETILRMVSDPSACPHALQGLAKLKQSFSREQFFTAFENFSKVSDDVD
jgi:glycosyltransferase involved in cell wall biosynthesis